MNVGKIVFSGALLTFASFYLWKIRCQKKYKIFSAIGGYCIASFLIFLFLQYPLGIILKVCGIHFSLSYFIYPVVLMEWLAIFDDISLKEKISKFVVFLLIFLVNEILVKMFLIIVCKLSLEEVIDYTAYYYFSDYLLLLICATNSLFCSIYYFLNVLSKRKRNIKIVVMVIILSFLFLIVVIMSCFFSIKYMVVHSNLFICYTLFLLLMIALVIISLIILYKITKEQIDIQKKVDELKRNQLESFYNESMHISGEELIKLHHDMANLLEVLKNYNQEATRNLIKNFQTLPKIYHYQNELINEILTIKQKKIYGVSYRY